MEIILLKDLYNVGEKHEIVKVKDGYGRNFLLPQGLAIVANSINKKRLADFIRQDEAKESQRVNEYKEMVSKLKGVTLRIGAKAGKSGKIFGSVTNIQLANAIKEQVGLEIERKKIHVPDDVKDLGTFTARIDLHKEVSCDVSFEVVGE
ncbi:MAG TPA: 50S ribosomal protein L9 [Saprospiraceae bacterium]|nr:50S ribosomal protein L9 [Saprospiraceae bacterium]